MIWWIKLAVVVITVPYILYQVRKPTRWVGQLFAGMMNRSHSGLTDWGLGHVAIGPRDRILDVGCGGGRTIAKLATLAPEGRVSGVDFAPGSVAVARRTNAKLIAQGRVEIQQAGVSQLPFPDGGFDLVTASETLYYWPDLPHDLAECRRVLRPGGTLFVLAESYKGSRQDALQAVAMKALRGHHLSIDEHRALFEQAGFTNVQTFEDRPRSWMCVTGVAPA